MFGDYVFEKTAAQYTKKILLVDADLMICTSGLIIQAF